jgi:hypothetical protein
MIAGRPGESEVGAVRKRVPAVGVRAVGGALLAGALAVVVLGGCQPSGSHDSAAPGSSSPSASPSPSAPGTGTPSAGPSSPRQPGPPESGKSTGQPSPTTDLETHKGTVERGVEPACLILRSSDGTYELVGGDQQAMRTLQPNANVVVRGYLETGLMSHCMQGKMFKVVSAQPAG